MKPFDPFDQELKSDPYALFKKYRDIAPVQLGCTSMPGYADTWYFFGFEEAKQLLRGEYQEPAHRSDAPDNQPLADARAELWKHLEGWPLFQEPPLHTSRRAMLANSFREPAISRLNQANRDHANSLLDSILENQGEAFDLQTDFAFPLAIGAITRAVGIPAPDTLWFKRITRKLVNVLDLGYVKDAYEPGLLALNEFIEFVHEMARWKANNLGDDLLSALLMPDADGNTLPLEVITQLITQILFAGQETVGDAIGNGVNSGIEYPEQLCRLRSDSGLMDNFIAEVLRFNNPVMFMGSRVLAQKTRFGNIVIPAGANTIVALAPCNHDPRRFNNPEQFDITRDLSGVELSFGYGIHYCLGAHYARQVMKIAFSTLLQKLPEPWKLAAPVVWRPNTILRGPLSLKLSLA